jgi:hypothetical protein
MAATNVGTTRFFSFFFVGRTRWCISLGLEGVVGLVASSCGGGGGAAATAAAAVSAVLSGTIVVLLLEIVSVSLFL